MLPGCSILLLLLLLLQGSSKLSFPEPGRIVGAGRCLQMPLKGSIKLPWSAIVGAHKGSGHAGKAPWQLLRQLLMHICRQLVIELIMHAGGQQQTDIWLAVYALVRSADLRTG